MPKLATPTESTVAFHSSVPEEAVPGAAEEGAGGERGESERPETLGSLGS